MKKGCVDCGKENDVVGCYGKVHRTDPWTLLVYGISTSVPSSYVVLIPGHFPHSG